MLCSRATSCYAVLRHEVAFLEDPYEDIDPHTFWLHTLKLSWLHLNLVHELTWFVRLQGDDFAGRLHYVARALGGGILTVAVEAIAPQGATREVKKQVMDQIIDLSCRRLGGLCSHINPHVSLRR